MEFSLLNPETKPSLPSRPISNQIEPNPYYIEKSSDLHTKVTEANVQILPFIHQPTPEGVMELCEHYSTKYNIDLQYLDMRDKTDSGAIFSKFFLYLQKNPAIFDLDQGGSKGVILGHGANHVIPLLIYNKDNKLHMVVFDSNAGCKIKGYFNIAAMFPTATFYLNAGTRQADDGSCMADALCILKEALQLNELHQLITSRLIKDHEDFKKSSTSIFTISKPDNFGLFKMPERLLFTAQISKYLEHADLNTLMRNGRSLKEYRDYFVIHVSMSKNGKNISSNISSYLYCKGIEHKNILDKRWKKQLQILEIEGPGSDDDISKFDSCGFMPVDVPLSPCTPRN